LVRENAISKFCILIILFNYEKWQASTSSIFIVWSDNEMSMTFQGPILFIQIHRIIMNIFLWKNF